MSPTKQNKVSAQKAQKGTRKASTGRKKSTHAGKTDLVGSSLVIVESPTKAKTLSRYLGASYTVMASGGHIIDLPPKRLGVNIEKNFKPEYKLLPGKRKIAKSLTAAAEQAKNIYLATDPDREGEAIAWHISRHIARVSNDGVYRVQFHEITRKAVEEAVANPGMIDMCKVDAQQARRVMDRIVGYQVSPLLWKTVAGGLSAGRVQSVALRLICERQEEIDAFVKEEYWTIDGLFSGEKVEPFKARLYKLDGGKVKIPDEKFAKETASRIQSADYHVIDIRKTRKKRNPFPPYITSTMQQDAGRRLGFPAKRIMSIAQRLYEGLEIGERGQTGLITYMRTDSTRVSSEAITAARDWIASKYGVEFVSSKPRIFKNKKGAVQDAHEAIRPTDVNLTPELVKSYLKPDEFKLYELIWRRFTATQMKSAEIDVTVVSIGDGKTIEFRASGEVVKFPGFLAVYADIKINGESEESTTPIPANLSVNMPLELVKTDPRQHFTQPPPRYTDAGLVKVLDELGIGRPSTYASIISTLLDRQYAERNKRSLVPTELGKTVNRILILSFPDIFNVKFTAEMEEELDRIETGGNWQQVVHDFYTPFNAALQEVEGRRKELKQEALQPVGRQCPECGKDLVYRWGKRGRFISCTGFPECHYSENIEKTPQIEVSEKCPKCGGEMMVREGKYGRFLGCKNYPKCRGVLPLMTGHKCPEENCDGNLVERRSKKGKVFYACDRYPDCRFTSWNPPIDGPCPKCNAPTLFEKSTQQGTFKYCYRCKENFEF